MGILYNKPGFKRLDFGAWWSIGIFHGYLNYFKHYGTGRGIEMFSIPMRKLSWVPRFLTDWAVAVHGGCIRRPYVDVKYDATWPKLSAITFAWLWFGIRIACPVWFARWRDEVKMRKLKAELDAYEATLPHYEIHDEHFGYED